MACERYIRSLLFGINATDALFLATPAAVLVLIAFIAALQPAAQAIRIDPAQALKCR